MYRERDAALADIEFAEPEHAFVAYFAGTEILSSGIADFLREAGIAQLRPAGAPAVNQVRHDPGAAQAKIGLDQEPAAIGNQDIEYRDRSRRAGKRDIAGKCGCVFTDRVAGPCQYRGGQYRTGQKSAGNKTGDIQCVATKNCSRYHIVLMIRGRVLPRQRPPERGDGLLVPGLVPAPASDISLPGSGLSRRGEPLAAQAVAVAQEPVERDERCGRSRSRRRRALLRPRPASLR